jgi:peptide/nickel transport system substrate-binding protein
MLKRRSILAGGGAALATGLARPSLAQGAKVLRYVPQANLANPDPIWTTATVAWLHGAMVWDMLYGIDEKLIPQPQMVESDEVSPDGLTWKMKLRDGLAFTDGEKVLPRDCIASIQRWGKRDGFGQRLMSQVAEMKELDDRTIQIRLTKPYPLMRYSLGYANCFIMPERIAKTDAFTQIKEYVGSGPFKFLEKEWVAGASAAWAKNEKYVPRSEKPSYFAGSKQVYFDRVEWKIIPDPATKLAALQSGEVDWFENPLFDQLPTLRKDPHITTEVITPLGALGVLAVNHELPPFDNLKLRQALWPAIDQDEYMSAVLGDFKKEYGHRAGFFVTGSPYATNVGMDILNGKRDLALAKKLVAESGYKGEPVTLMSPSDQDQLVAMAQVTDAMFKAIGINSQYTSMDWATLVARRAKHEPPSQGGWNAFCTTWGGLSVSNPGGHFPLRGNGKDGWFGWPTDPQMEALREKWFEAPDLAAGQKVCEEMQQLAFKNVPFYPCGDWTTPTAYRKTIKDIVRSGLYVFWGVKPA